MNDLDYAKSSARTQEERIPFLEYAREINPTKLQISLWNTYSRARAIHEEWFWDLLAAGMMDPIEQATAMPRDCPRVLKTHLSLDMLPDQVMQKRNKVIYV